jgi:xylulokinase
MVLVLRSEHQHHFLLKDGTDMAAKYLIGIDIGTSGAKAVVMDPAGKLLGFAGREYPILTPQAGWAEQEPEEWLSAALVCVRESIDQAGIEPRQVVGVSLAGQMHSLVCLGADGRSLRPAILWADQRSAKQVRALEEKIGRANLAAWTGNPLAAGFMLASWAWLLEHEPEITAKTHWLVLPKDYIRFRLAGKIGTEPSDASSTLLFDPHRRDWSEPLLASIGLDRDRLPRVFPSASAAGGMLPEIARACGLLSGTPVIFGGSDVSLQALSLGILAPGTVSCTIGTGGQLFAPLSAPVHDPELRLHLFCHCLPGTWHQEAAILAAGLCLRWLRDQVLPGSDYASLADAAQQVEAALDGVFFFPFLAGERTPYMNANLRAAFTGLALRHGQAHMVRAVMEGVVFALRQGLDLMQLLGTPVDQLVATGGATRHPLWLQLEADIFNRPVYVSPAPTGRVMAGADTARGAALLAGIGSGVFADPSEALERAVPQPVPGAKPQPGRADLYAAAYRQYCSGAQTYNAIIEAEALTNDRNR